MCQPLWHNRSENVIAEAHRAYQIDRRCELFNAFPATEKKTRLSRLDFDFDDAKHCLLISGKTETSTSQHRWIDSNVSIVVAALAFSRAFSFMRGLVIVAHTPLYQKFKLRTA